MTEEDAKERLQQSVSRETFARLQQYAALLVKWQKAINLVSKGTLSHLWARHFLDSAQLFDLAERRDGHWVDIGSGSGFPALVCAIFAREKAPGLRFSLIESDQRKCSFLRTVVAETGLEVKIIADRIETAIPQNADLLSARALAPLTTLNEFAERHRKPDGVALFPKGATFRREIDEALETWTMNVESVRSITSPESVILKIGEITRV